jgi:lipoate-protein ligase B
METHYFFDSQKTSYEWIWDFQKAKIDQILEGKSSESLIFCEHESVITAGRRYRRENLIQSEKNQPLPVHYIERGGDFTWHGPGQLVIYPIWKLNGEIFPYGLSEYLRFCEQWVIEVLQSHGLDAGRYGETGVWIRSAIDSKTKKIASIGVAVRRWITYHGIALNYSNDWDGFSRIRPCNFEASTMTSMEKEGVKISRDEMVKDFERVLLELQARDLGGRDIAREQAG